MNPGPSEEVGKVAIGVIDALKTNPILIVLILLNAMIFGMIYFTTSERHKIDSDIMKLLLTQQGQAQELLAKCVVPNGK